VERTGFRRKPESSNSKKFWTPAFAGVTLGATFYENLKFAVRNLWEGLRLQKEGG